jgi:hypothetical protein
MGRTVDELGATMSPQEFLAHHADFQREPWGSRMVVVMLAQVCAILCNVNRGKDTPAFTPADFLPGQRDAPVASPTTFSDLTATLKGL